MLLPVSASHATKNDVQLLLKLKLTGHFVEIFVLVDVNVYTRSKHKLLIQEDIYHIRYSI